MFGKRPSDLTQEDIELLIKEQVQEGSQIELKVALPARKGQDAWVSGEQKVGDYARNELLAEVIAFANAHGGWLFVGIKETDDHPKRAKDVAPLRNCAELADRLRLMCRDCIEPQVPVLEVAGIPFDEDSAGVVVFYIPQSRMAPHRHLVTKECYIRRADRTEKMTMREIQDLTLQVERGIGAIERIFERKAQNHLESLNEFSGETKQAFGIRATAVPTIPLYLSPIHHNKEAQPPLITLSGTLGESGPYELFVPVSPYNWRPILRGTCASEEFDNLSCQLEVHCDGLIHYRFLARKSHDNYLIYVQWVMGIVSNIMCAVEKFRDAAGAPDVEFALEVEILVIGEPVGIGKYGRDIFRDNLGPFPSSSTAFPRYSLGPREEFSDAMELFELDFWNAASVDQKKKLLVDFQSAFRELGHAKEAVLE